MTVRSPGLAPPTDGSTPPDLVRQPYLATFKRLVTFELLIHQLDVLRSLFGEFEVTSVEMDRVNPDLVGEDVAIIVMRGENGMTVVVDGSMSAPGYPARPSDRLELVGTKDTMISTATSCSSWAAMSRPWNTTSWRTIRPALPTLCWTSRMAFRTGEPFWTDRLDTSSPSS